MPVIVFTGGGTAGHVTPNFPLIDYFKSEGWGIEYIGSESGPEAGLLARQRVSFHPIQSGKLRRYFSWQNFIDPFKILYGVFQAWRILAKLNASVVFSKGGFVAFPVVVAAWLRRIPVVIHESDFSPGLANRLSFPFARKICLTFNGAKAHFSNVDKVAVTGTPVRVGLDDGIKGKGLDICGFSAKKKTLMVMGGSMGSNILNQVIREALPRLDNEYQIIHICGRAKVDQSLLNKPSYCQFEYADEDLPHLLAAADTVVSRAGANTLYELLLLRKLHLLVPLSARVSRGDQIENAHYFERRGASKVLAEESLSVSALIDNLQQLELHRDTYLSKIDEQDIQSATEAIVRIIKEQLQHENPVHT